MVHTVDNAKHDRGRIGFWVLIGILAVSGISMAFIAIFGAFDTIAYSMAWRVFVADIYLIAALAAQHNWLRIAAWIGTAVVFIIGMVNVFWDSAPEDQWSARYEYGRPSTGWNPWWDIEIDVEVAAHLLLGTLLLLGFISLAYRWISGERLLRSVYVFTFVLGIASALLGAFLVIDTPYRWNTYLGLGQLAAGLIILALTGAAIIIIAGFVQRKAARARAAALEGAGGVGLADQAADRVAPSLSQGQVAALSADDLRLLVREYVDEYLAERDKE